MHILLFPQENVSFICVEFLSVLYLFLDTLVPYLEHCCTNDKILVYICWNTKKNTLNFFFLEKEKL